MNGPELEWTGPGYAPFWTKLIQLLAALALAVVCVQAGISTERDRQSAHMESCR